MPGTCSLAIVTATLTWALAPGPVHHYHVYDVGALTLKAGFGHPDLSFECKPGWRTYLITPVDANHREGPNSQLSEPILCLAQTPDLSGDGWVGIADFGLLVGDQTDFNGDGFFSIMDVSLFSAAFGCEM